MAHKEYDYDALLVAEDVRQEIHTRFAEHAKVGGPSGFWMMNWTTMTVVYMAQLLQLDVGKMKKLTRELRKNTDEWWRKAWDAWRATDVGIGGVDSTDRKARLMAAWQAAKDILGDDYRNERGRRMGETMAMKGWSWVRVGQHLRKWMTPDTKARALENVLDDYDRHEANWMALEAAGVKLDRLTTDEDEQYSDDDDSADSESEEEIIDLVDDITHMRKWDEGGSRKRTAREVADDEDETVENRDAARAWIRENTKIRAKHKRAEKQRKRRARKARTTR